MPFLRREATKIYYKEDPILNGENADTIILIHTNLMDHTIYDQMIPLLNNKFNIVRYDLRGFGSSDLAHEELTLDLYVEDLKLLINSLHLQSVHLVGFGFGGLIALKFSTLYEKLVEKLILMTIACFPEESYESVRAHRRKITSNGTKIPVETLIKKVTSLKTDDPEYARLHKMVRQVPYSTYKKIMDLTLYTNPIPLLKKTTKDVLILAAEREVVFPQNLLISTVSYLANFHYTVVPNSSSFLMIDQPFFTAQLLTEFLTKEKVHRYTEDQVANEIYECIRGYAEKVYTLGSTTERTVNEIRVDFLYSFKVEINGKQIVTGWNQRYAKQILIYLLLHQTVTREQICEQIWPDIPLKMSKKNLRVYLFHLKRILNEASLLHQPLLTFDREHIYLNGKISSDALSFLTEIQLALDTEQDELKYSRVQKVLNKISSPSYLTVIFDNWFLELRDKVEQDILHLSVWMVKFSLKNEEWKTAKHLLQKCMYIFDDHEEIHTVLFELYSQIPDYELDDWIKEKVQRISLT